MRYDAQGIFGNVWSILLKCRKSVPASMQAHPALQISLVSHKLYQVESGSTLTGISFRLALKDLAVMGSPAGTASFVLRHEIKAQIVVETVR